MKNRKDVLADIISHAAALNGMGLDCEDVSNEQWASFTQLMGATQEVEGMLEALRTRHAALTVRIMKLVREMDGGKTPGLDKITIAGVLTVDWGLKIISLLDENDATGALIEEFKRDILRAKGQKHG